MGKKGTHYVRVMSGLSSPYSLPDPSEHLESQSSTAIEDAS